MVFVPVAVFCVVMFGLALTRARASVIVSMSASVSVLVCGSVCL